MDTTRKNETVNIICLLWKGDFRGRDYCDEDVHRLKWNIDHQCDRPYQMYCLTNDMGADVPAEKIQLLNNWPGWWSKVELFREDLPEGKTLYLDLDTYIVDNLQRVLDYPVRDLVMFPTPYDGDERKNKERKVIIPRYQAGVMLFHPGRLLWVYDKFRANSESFIAYYRSEQDVYGEWLPSLETFPAEWLMKIGFLKRKKVNGYNDLKQLCDVIFVTGRPSRGTFRLPWFAPWLVDFHKSMAEKYG